MRITKRQLRRIIRETRSRIISEQPEMDMDVYKAVNEAIWSIVDNMFKNSGATPAVVAAIVKALEDVRSQVPNDATGMSVEEY